MCKSVGRIYCFIPPILNIYDGDFAVRLHQTWRSGAGV